MSEEKDKLNKDELVKSLQDLEFTQEEIDTIISKAEKDGKIASGDDEVVEKPEDYDKEEMKKAYDKVMSMKDELDKSMTDFLDKYGSVPGFTKPTDDVAKKSVEADIEKSEEKEEKKEEVIEKSMETEGNDDLMKSFDSKFEDIQKSFVDKFEEQGKINEQILKSLTEVSATVKEIAETPNPMKGLFGSYKDLLLEKGGDKTNEDGQKVYSLSKDKSSVVDAFEKAIDKVENEKDKSLIRDMISTYTINKSVNDTGLNIVKKALNIDFEK